jgi:hypothetical protein
MRGMALEEYVEEYMDVWLYRARDGPETPRHFIDTGRAGTHMSLSGTCDVNRYTVTQATGLQRSLLDRLMKKP